MKKIATYLLTFVLIGGLSSFKPDNDHRNIITVNGGTNWVWRADNCSAPTVSALTVRQMASSKGFFMVDVTFQLPQGHCDIPPRGTIVRHYEGQDQMAVIHSDGLVRGKILVRAN
jgi:hypothetical protein